MVRYAYINNVVLQIYKKLPSISFPIDSKEIMDIIPNCKFMSYQHLANLNRCPINDIITLCESNSGCTYYDKLKKRYLILCNQSTKYNNKARQRWTCMHEIGHIVCGHFKLSASLKFSENSLVKCKDCEYESEADYFAATILSPFPLFKMFNICSEKDVQATFGLSAEASSYRFAQYEKWKKSRYKTAWENDIIKTYKLKM